MMRYPVRILSAVAILPYFYKDIMIRNILFSCLVMLSVLSAPAQGGNGVRRVKAVNVNDMRFEFVYDAGAGDMPVAFTGVQGGKRVHGSVKEEADCMLCGISSADGDNGIGASIPKKSMDNGFKLSVSVMFSLAALPLVVKDTYFYSPVTGRIKRSIRDFLDKKTYGRSDEVQPVSTLYEWSDDGDLVLIKNGDYPHERSYCELENKKTSVDILAFAGCIGNLDDSRLCVLDALLGDLFHTRNLISYEEQPDVREIYSYTIDGRGYIESMTVVTELKSDGTQYNQRRITVEYEE